MPSWTGRETSWMTEPDVTKPKSVNNDCDSASDVGALSGSAMIFSDRVLDTAM